MTEKIKTACPLNCFDVCGLIVTVEASDGVSDMGTGSIIYECAVAIN